jgi:hypothetical protein
MSVWPVSFWIQTLHRPLLLVRHLEVTPSLTQIQASFVHYFHCLVLDPIFLCEVFDLSKEVRLLVLVAEIA